jgi:hypothetical protein
MKKLSLFLCLIFGLSCITNAQEPAPAKKNRKRPDQATKPAAKKDTSKPQSEVAPKLPPPEKETFRAIEMESKQSALAGKIVKIRFNRIAYMQKFGTKSLYTGNLRSNEKSDSRTYTSHPGIQVIFPKEGLGLFSKFIPKSGTVKDDISILVEPDVGEVYVRIGLNEKDPATAVGDRHEQDDDGGQYTWSVDAEVPDLTSKNKVTANDVLLFPDQLNGKTVEVEFYNVLKSKSKSADQSSVYITCGIDHGTIQTSFPPEGTEFLNGIEAEKNYPKAHTLHAVVSVSSAGIVTLKAKGRRASGSGDDVTYKW